MRSSVLSLARLALPIASALALASPPAAAATNQTKEDARDKSWTQFAEHFLEQYFQLNPGVAVAQGRADYRGQLPDWSAAGIRDQADFLRLAIKQAKAFPAQTLTVSQRLERDHLLLTAEGQLFLLEELDQPHSDPAYYVPRGLLPDPYFFAAGDARERMEGFVALARKLPAVAATIKANLQGPIAAEQIDNGAMEYRRLAESFGQYSRQAFSEVEDQALQRDLAAASAVAAEAMRELAAWLEGRRSSAAPGSGLGPQRFARLLATAEGVDTPIDELERAGLAELRRNQAAIGGACAEFAPGASVKECVARMNGNKPADPVAAANQSLAALRQLLVERDLVSMPASAAMTAEAAPPYFPGSFNVYWNGPFSEEAAIRFYVSQPDPGLPSDQRMAAVPATKEILRNSAHEVWPGHFLGLVHPKRSIGMIGRVFPSAASFEGWAHYAEEMMIEEGLGRGDPEARIGQLANALLRSCRYVAIVGLHSGRMTRAESDALFTDQCHQSEEAAPRLTARALQSPLGLVFTMGKMMVRKLRGDWAVQHPGRPLKEFHDSFLDHGSVPVPLLRRALLGDNAKPLL